MNGNPNGFLLGIGVGLIIGFFAFTAIGREIVLTAGERATLEARERVIPKIRG